MGGSAIDVPEDEPDLMRRLASFSRYLHLFFTILRSSGLFTRLASECRVCGMAQGNILQGPFTRALGLTARRAQGRSPATSPSPVPIGSAGARTAGAAGSSNMATDSSHFGRAGQLFLMERHGPTPRAFRCAPFRSQPRFAECTSPRVSSRHPGAGESMGADAGFSMSGSSSRGPSAREGTIRSCWRAA
jgi:hypothetical protein